MKQTTLDQLLNAIRVNSRGATLNDDEENFDIQGACGGNFDDAYSLGVDDGYTLFARELMKIIKEGK